MFWRRGIFGNQVVLNQAWALDGIYAVLHRTTTLPVIRSQGGHFTRELLAALVWSNYSAEEQNFFLSMMIQCGTCFEVALGHYVAPSLLPDADRTEKDRLLIWRDLETEVSVRLDYSFLHEGIVRSALCKVAESAGTHGIYWNAGVCYYDGNARGPIQIRAQFPGAGSQTGSGSIHIEGAGANALAIVRHLAGSVMDIPIGNRPAVNWLRSKHKQRTSGDDSDPEHKTEPFSLIRPEQPPVPAGSKPIVHVSYAWGNESDKIVDALEQELQGHGYQVRRDKSVMRPGDWISTFMK